MQGEGAPTGGADFGPSALHLPIAGEYVEVPESPGDGRRLGVPRTRRR